MMQLITPEYYGEFVPDLAEMHRLRYRVFKQRLDWNVEASGDMRSTNSMSFVRSIY
ncbi:acyl-homoserine-lactone synthase [Bradyrhizobium ottawaense]|uniref:acyl-homoserine-lactone synthase n=1 Tax=Bradyrhizobium ottawaense TaxID=931866 RepID=UPI003D321CD3